MAKSPTTTLSSWWSADYYGATTPYIKALRRQHPDYSPEQLLLSAVAIASANEENSFFVYTLKDFWKKKPAFIKSSNTRRNEMRPIVFN